MSETRRGRWAFLAGSAAVLCGAGILPAAFWLPLYATSTASSSGRVSSGSETLIAANGAGVGLFVLLVAPAVLALVAWLGLRRTCTRGGTAGRRLAIACMALLAGLALLALMTIGAAMLPCLALIAVAYRLTPAPAATTVA